MGSNIIHLSDFAVPSYRRTRAAGVHTTQALAAGPDGGSGSAWASMARQRAAQKWQVTPERNGALTAPTADSEASNAAVLPLHAKRVATTPCAGAVRLSGRLADVCAELERLAAAEAAQMAA
jgi:hypothetical protein